MSTFRLLATNTVAQTVAKITTVLTTLAISRMIANPQQGLGVVGYEDFGIIIAYAAYFYMVSDFGLNAVAAKDITQEPAKTKSYINNLLSLRLGLSILLIFLGLAALAFIDYKTTIKLGILCSLITIVSQAAITNSNLLFQTKLQYWQATIAVVAGSLVSLCLAGLTYMSHGSLFMYVIANVVGSLVIAALSLILVNNQVRLKLQFDWPVWRYLIMAAMPLGLAVILNIIYIRAGFFILSLHTGQTDQAYGLLSAAYRIFDVALVIPVFVVNALYPIMVSRLHQQADQFKQLFVKACFAMMGLSVVIAVAIWLTAPLAIHLTTNDQQFDQSIVLLRWLSLIIPIFFITNLLLWAIIALGKRTAVVFIYGIGALISLVANMWLVPLYSYWAVIAVTGVTEALVALLLATQLWTLWRQPNLETSIDPAIDNSIVASLSEEEVIV